VSSKKSIWGVIVIFILLIVFIYSWNKNDNLKEQLISKFIATDEKNIDDDIPDEMKEIKSELDDINTKITSDIIELKDTESTLSNKDPLDEKIKTMDQELAIINKKEGIDGEAIKNNIHNFFTQPLANKNDVQQINKTDNVILEVEKNMNDLNIKGE
jgi:transcriptional regulator of met regulon